MPDVIRALDYCDVQCDRCKALHPLRQVVGHALTCVDRLNSQSRPCPACGARGQWVVRLKGTNVAR